MMSSTRLSWNRPFRGYADFLKRDGAGDGGQPLYEVWDTKLARKTKPYYLVQLCCYAEMLASIQGVLPPKVRVLSAPATCRNMLPATSSTTTAS